MQQEDMTVINIYTPNNTPSKYMKQKPIELKGEINSFTIIVGYLYNPLLVMDRTTRWKISKETKDLTQ